MEYSCSNLYDELLVVILLVKTRFVRTVEHFLFPRTKKLRKTESCLKR
jgi:hypothetical protein